MDISFSKETIYVSHVVIGLFLSYLGYNLLNNKPVNRNLTAVLLILGSMATLYHGHMLYVVKFKK